jgi:microcystin-dependent protein
MSDPFVAEIRVVGFNFAPNGWAFCDGQLMSISQNTALFSLLGTNYGGDGMSTFGLPNLQDSVAVQQGQGPGLSAYFLGEQLGEDSVTLLESEMPVHQHGEVAAIDIAEAQAPAPDRALARSGPGLVYQTETTNNLTQLSPFSVGVAGSGLPHNNVSPVLVLNYVIALQGIFPQRP